MSGSSAAARAWRSAVGERFEARHRWPERVGPAVVRDEPLRGLDDLERTRLAFLRRVTPCGDPVPSEDRADGLGVVATDLGHVQSELETRAPPLDPDHPVAEALACPSLPVDGRRQGDARIRVKVIDVVGVDQPMHRGVDRRCGAAATMEAVVEGRDHLVLAVDPGVHVDKGAQPVQPQDGQARLRERAQVATRALDPHQLDRRPGRRIDPDPLGGGIAPGVIRIARVRPQTVRTLQQRRDRRIRIRGQRPDAHAPQPACWPPTRSATIRSP